MMKRSIFYFILAIAAAILSGCAENGDSIIENASIVTRSPALYPDYSDITIPFNIAPLNFSIQERGEKYLVRIHSASDDVINISSSSPTINIPEKAWKTLLENNREQELIIDIHVKTDKGDWKHFNQITNRISENGIDPYLTYRLIKPLYNYWTDISIHQRNLMSFSERKIFGNKGIEKGCCNCHTPFNNSPDTMLLHTRSALGVGMFLVNKGDVTGINSRTPFGAPMAYSTWHPSGGLIAFSVNRVKQFFHTTGDEVRDVVDLDSSLGIYSVDKNTIIKSSPHLSKLEYMETYPRWSPDGRYLYFCRTVCPWTEQEKKFAEENASFPSGYETIRYDLMRISYSIENNSWGDLETVISSSDIGKSITQPKFSPDGRHLFFTMSDYGCFPVFQSSADIGCLTIETGDFRRLDINSDVADTWHSLSRNGRWIVFSSKRGNGLFARPHFTYFDENGVTGKPFILPQKNPLKYDSCMKTFNVPEFTTGPINISDRAFVNANASLVPIVGADIAITSATPKSQPPIPGSN